MVHRSIEVALPKRREMRRRAPFATCSTTEQYPVSSSHVSHMVTTSRRPTTRNPQKAQPSTFPLLVMALNVTLT